MENLGVQIHHLRKFDEIYEKGDEVLFDVYVVAEPNKADGQELSQVATKEETRHLDPSSTVLLTRKS
eukprot:scaffold11976_cov120-Cylindrotheca_fusiformis.AAC.1